MSRSWRSNSGNTNSISSRTRTGARRVRITARSTCEMPWWDQLISFVCLLVWSDKVPLFDFNCTLDAASICSHCLTFSSAGVGVQTHAWPGGAAARTGPTSHFNPREYLRLSGAAWSRMHGPMLTLSLVGSVILLQILSASVTLAFGHYVH